MSEIVFCFRRLKKDFENLSVNKLKATEEEVIVLTRYLCKTTTISNEESPI